MRSAQRITWLGRNRTDSGTGPGKAVVRVAFTGSSSARYDVRSTPTSETRG